MNLVVLPNLMIGAQEGSNRFSDAAGGREEEEEEEEDDNPADTRVDELRLKASRRPPERSFKFDPDCSR